jgi:hypothetical protein
MSYVYTLFDTTALPQLEVRQPFTTPDTLGDVVQLAGGGGYDTRGLGQALGGPQTITLSGEIVDTTPAAVATSYRALEAKWGVRGRLYREWLGDSTSQWKTARLVKVSTTVTTDTAFVLPVSLTFELTDWLWYGSRHSSAGWTFDSGVYFDTGRVFDEASGDLFTLTGTAATVVALTNGGNAAVPYPTLTVTAGNSAISSVRIVGNGTDMTWTGTLAATKALVLTPGAWSVTNDGTNALSTLVFNAGHTISRWIEIPSGSTNFTITLVGGGTGSTLGVDYSDAWKG